MVTIKRHLAVILVVLCVLLVGCMVNLQPIFSRTIQPDSVATPQVNATAQSSYDLTRAVLSEIAMPRRYDLYLGNSVDIAAPPEALRNDEFAAWLHALFVQEAGWNYVEDHYVAQLEANFSEPDLRELQSLAQHPLIQRFIQAEMDAYLESVEERRTLLSQLWEDYNSGTFSPPPNGLQ